MDYVYLSGGIGNQTFQYALYTALKEKGHNVKLDTSALFKYLHKMKRCHIFDAFVLDDEVRTSRVKRQMACAGLPYLHSHGVLRRTLLKCYGVYQDPIDKSFDPSLLSISHGYFDGIWQTEKYFDFCRDKVREAFQLKNPLPDNNVPFLKQIQSAETPISIHVRLGDYLAPEWVGYLGNICTEHYYRQAIGLMLERYPDATFFVFSNEIAKVKEMLDGIKYVAVDVNDERTGWADMYLISRCRHHIIANSSFSWWGAWLDSNPRKTVIAPRVWTNAGDLTDICPDGWIRI